MIKINETLPWIELENEYQTRVEARKKVKNILNHAEIKIVQVQRKAQRVKVLATVK